ncbi:hypothetical protein EVAR_19201_1 [Eumeta japonica]|uniref:Uncharacterized protein n=1 Tax=Eumeta variegata TaxID=151549 RepID=A0A4C1VFJ1_EUMVA|nr:hypothetical protein EVAR_19201_1 [Eumeta japonica]
MYILHPVQTPPKTADAAVSPAAVYVLKRKQNDFSFYCPDSETPPGDDTAIKPRPELVNRPNGPLLQHEHSMNICGVFPEQDSIRHQTMPSVQTESDFNTSKDFIHHLP